MKIKVKIIYHIQEYTGEDVIKFEDENGINYLWFTRAINSKINIVEDDELCNISFKIKGYNSDNIAVIKNVRLLKA